MRFTMRCDSETAFSIQMTVRSTACLAILLHLDINANALVIRAVQGPNVIV
jgi:hypothetical protein